MTKIKNENKNLLAMLYTGLKFSDDSFSELREQALDGFYEAFVSRFYIYGDRANWSDFQRQCIEEDLSSIEESLGGVNSDEFKFFARKFYDCISELKKYINTLMTDYADKMVDINLVYDSDLGRIAKALQAKFIAQYQIEPKHADYEFAEESVTAPEGALSEIENYLTIIERALIEKVSEVTEPLCTDVDMDDTSLDRCDQKILDILRNDVELEENIPEQVDYHAVRAAGSQSLFLGIEKISTARLRDRFFVADQSSAQAKSLSRQESISVLDSSLRSADLSELSRINKDHAQFWTTENSSDINHLKAKHEAELNQMKARHAAEIAEVKADIAGFNEEAKVTKRRASTF